MNALTVKAAGALALLSLSAAAAPSQIPKPAHVVIVVEENHDYADIIGSPDAPYINSLAADSDAALFTQSFALTHPSQPNYLMLFSGSEQGITSDSLPKNLPFAKDNLGGLLIKAGKTFAGYSEDLPQAGFDGEKSGEYARKHNPWANWQNSTSCGIPPACNLPFSAFPAHFDSLPTVAFACPNLTHDMHNGADPATIATADTWLREHLDGYIRWARKNNGLFILTFDEGKTKGDNRIATLFVGAMVKQGNYPQRIDHYSVLRTVEDMFALTHAGNSAGATPITDCWKGKTASLAAIPAPADDRMNGFTVLNPFYLESSPMTASVNSGSAVFNLLGRAFSTAQAVRSFPNSCGRSETGRPFHFVYFMKHK
jgi:phosphatidylinositol-3-phosphatase